jgi:DNA-binding transcriptional LysR family regulator
MYNLQIEMFIRVADAGSFSKAAKEHYITPTAVIKQINSFEAGLGLRLFTQTHWGLTLTDSGKSLYTDA